MAHENSEKGRALERAVKFIQEMMLESDPKLKGVKFSVEPNETVVVNGTPHEIDVLVKTLPDSPYEAKWIFECKNWKKPVGKNEVMILVGKVEALSASRGVLVAEKITKGARSLIEHNPKLEYLQCTTDFLSPLHFDVFQTVHEPQSTQVSIKIRGIPAESHPRSFEWEGKICLHCGHPTNFREYIIKQVDAMAKEDNRGGDPRYHYEGVHPSAKRMELTFEPNELVVGDMDIERMAITVTFFVTVEKRKVISKFEVKGQGRVTSHDVVIDSLGSRMDIHFIQQI